MPWIDEAEGNDYYTEAAFQRPYMIATNERLYASTNGAGPVSIYRPDEADLVGEDATIGFWVPGNLLYFHVPAISDTADPEALADTKFEMDTPAVPDTDVGVYGATGRHGGSAPVRRRPAEFRSLSYSDLLTGPLGNEPIDDDTIAPTNGQFARNLADGLIYERVSGSWSLDDPQQHPPTLLELEYVDGFKTGDVLMPDVFNLQRDLMAPAKWTTGAGSFVYPPGESWNPELVDAITNYGRNDNSATGGLYINAWLSRTYGAGDPELSPSPSSVAATLVPLAQSIIETDTWYTSNFAVPPGFGARSYSQVIYPYVTFLNLRGRTSTPDNASTFYDSDSPVNTSSPVNGEPEYWSAVLIGGQGATGEHIVVATNGIFDGDDPHDADDLQISRSIDIWRNAYSSGSEPFNSAGAFDEGWSTVETLEGPEYALDSTTISQFVPPDLPVVDPIIYLDPGATPGTNAAQSSVSEYVHGFQLAYQTGLIRWDRTDGFVYVTA